MGRVKLRNGGNQINSAMGSFEKAFGLTRSVMDAMDQADINKSISEGMTASEGIAAQPGAQSFAVDSGQIDKADLGAGGGENLYQNKDDADSAFRQASEIESMKSMPDSTNPEAEAEYMRSFSGFPKPEITSPVIEQPEPLGTGKSIDYGAAVKRAVDRMPERPESTSNLVPRGISQRTIEAPKKNAMDVFQDKFVPGIQAKMIKSGRIKDADAFGEWAKNRQNSAYGNAYSKAAMMEMSGNHEGAIKALSPIYNAMVPDGHFAETIPGEDGKSYTVNIRRESDNALVNSHTAETSEMSKLALGMLSPLQMFEQQQKAEAERNKPVKLSEGEVVFDAKGNRLFGNEKNKTDTTSFKAQLKAAVDSGDITPDKARQLYVAKLEKDAGEQATGYRAELDGAVASGKISQQQSDAMYMDYLDKKSKAGGGTNINIEGGPTITSLRTDPVTGKVTAMGVYKGKPFEQDAGVDTGAVEVNKAKLVKEGLDEVDSIIKASGTLPPVEDVAGARGRVADYIKQGFTPMQAAEFAIKRQGYDEYMKRFNQAAANNDKKKLDSIVKQGKEQGFFK